MILGNKFEVETMLVHECGEKLRVILEVFGEGAEAKVSSEAKRITCTSFFTRHRLYFLPQGESFHVKSCPECFKRLPLELQEVNEQEFTQLPAKVS